MGSSASRMDGSLTRARATATRWRWWYDHRDVRTDGIRKMRELLVLAVVSTLILVLPATSQERSEPRADSSSADLLRLHERLRNPKGDPHDDYISAIYIGNEETVPLLLERLRQDYGATEPTPRPGFIAGFVCTQVHLVDALRTITNTDQGMFYPGWARWWETNRELPRDTWIRNGFVEAGLHPLDPPDEKFALELIEAQAGERSYYLSTNARRLLARQDAEQRTAWAAAAAQSEKPRLRLGALRLLAGINTKWAEGLIRALTDDSDGEIRDLAAEILRERPDASRR